MTPNKLIEAVFNNTLNSVDHDSDGIINFEEFQELMMKCMDWVFIKHNNIINCTYHQKI